MSFKAFVGIQYVGFFWIGAVFRTIVVQGRYRRWLLIQISKRLPNLHYPTQILPSQENWFISQLTINVAIIEWTLTLASCYTTQLSCINWTSGTHISHRTQAHTQILCTRFSLILGLRGWDSCYTPKLLKWSQISEQFKCMHSANWTNNTTDHESLPLLTQPSWRHQRSRVKGQMQ